jgi:hypothetical protein
MEKPGETEESEVLGCFAMEEKAERGETNMTPGCSTVKEEADCEVINPASDCFAVEEKGRPCFTRYRRTR